MRSLCVEINPGFKSGCSAALHVEAVAQPFRVDFSGLGTEKPGGVSILNQFPFALWTVIRETRELRCRAVLGKVLGRNTETQ
jgi:hypothetical protein